MSTPVKPPGGPPSAPSASELGGARIEERPNELRGLVESASESDVQASSTRGSATVARVDGIRAELAAGQIDPNEAVERLVQHAMSRAAGLSDAHRAALEEQLRSALAEDPTLVALRKDLERGSPQS